MKIDPRAQLQSHHIRHNECCIHPPRCSARGEIVKSPGNDDEETGGHFLNFGHKPTAANPPGLHPRLVKVSGSEGRLHASSSSFRCSHHNLHQQFACHKRETILFISHQEVRETMRILPVCNPAKLLSLFPSRLYRATLCMRELTLPRGSICTRWFTGIRKKPYLIIESMVGWKYRVFRQRGA